MKYISVTLPMRKFHQKSNGCIYEENLYFPKDFLPVFINYLYILSMGKKVQLFYLEGEILLMNKKQTNKKIKAKKPN